MRANAAAWVKEASDGALWLSYPEPSGITRFTAEGDRLTVSQYGVAQGMQSDKVYSLGTDARGGVWAGTEAGVDYLDMDHGGGRWRHFGRHDGLVSEDTDSDSFWADPDGTVWIGTSRGLAHFRPRAAAAAEPAPEPRILSVELGGKARDLSQPLRTGPGERSLYVTFTSLTFRHEHDVRFRYRLRGLDQNWSETAHRDARYPSLPPGKYTFEVAASLPGAEISRRRWSSAFRRRGGRPGGST